MLLSQRAYAKHRGVAESAVRRAIESGRITTTDGKIDPGTADKQWEQNTNPAYHQTRGGGDSDDSPFSYKASRARRETYEALLKKLEYERESGKLIPIAQVETEAFNAARLMRDKLLNIPDKVIPQLIGKTDIFEMKQILRKEIHDSLVNLTGWLHGNKQ